MGCAGLAFDWIPTHDSKSSLVYTYFSNNGRLLENAAGKKLAFLNASVGSNILCNLDAVSLPFTFNTLPLRIQFATFENTTHKKSLILGPRFGSWTDRGHHVVVNGTIARSFVYSIKNLNFCFS